MVGWFLGAAARKREFPKGAQRRQTNTTAGFFSPRSGEVEPHEMMMTTTIYTDDKRKRGFIHNTIHNPHLPGWKLRGEKGRRGHFSLSVSTRTPHLPNFPRSGKGFSMIGLCSLAPSLLACIRVDADVVSWLIESTTTTTKEKNIVKSCEVSLLAFTTDTIRIRP